MTKKTRLIPFNWDQYKNGAKAVCRNPEILVKAIFPRFSATFPFLLVYYHEEDDCKTENITTDGLCSFGDITCGNDVFLEEYLEEKTFYVNVFKNGVEHLTYNNLENATLNKNHERTDYLGLLKVTYTNGDLIK